MRTQHLFLIKMVQIVCILLLALFSTAAFSQTSEGEIKKYKQDCQTGYFIKKDGKWLRHGIWKHHYASAEYDNGQMVWIELKDGRKFTSEQIKIKQLELKIARLEERIASN